MNALSATFPPSARDFLAYERIIIDGDSTRQAAEELKISQTRVRQIVRRVADWLAENLPETNETREASQIRLAQHIAGDRLHRYFCEADRAWHQTHETKYLTAIIRLLTALSKIPAQPFTLAALAADAIEQSTGEDEVSAEPTATTTPTRSASEGLTPSTTSVPSTISCTELGTPNSPPPIRHCSPSESTKLQAAPQPTPPSTLSPTPQSPFTNLSPSTHAARQSFFAPAHSSTDTPTNLNITQLTITPETFGLTPPHRSTPQDRRRLQRLMKTKS